LISIDIQKRRLRSEWNKEAMQNIQRQSLYPVRVRPEKIKI
jgi:hypothetical protein